MGVILVLGRTVVSVDHFFEGSSPHLFVLLYQCNMCTLYNRNGHLIYPRTTTRNRLTLKMAKVTEK